MCTVLPYLHALMLASAYVLGAVLCLGSSLLVTYMGYIIWQNERQESMDRKRDVRGPMIDVTPRRR